MTPKGFSEKSKLVVEYLETSLGFFREAREEYNTIFNRAKACGINKVIFIGSGELAEIAFLSACEQEVEVIGLHDNEISGEKCHGMNVLREIEFRDNQTALVITSSRSPQVTFDEISKKYKDAQILHPAFLHISTEVKNHA